MNDLQRAAARARPALAVLTAELGEPSPDAARALVVLGQMLDDIEAGRHPLDRPDDWPHRDRWPDRPHWDRWRWAIKTLAVASGTNAHCSPKYEYMRVDTRQARSDALTVALLDVADVIELASVREPSGTIDSFLGLCAGRTTPALTIDDMNKIAAAGWAGELEPADATSQRFASVWDAIEGDPAEAEKMKRWSALRRRADAMATLLCVQPVGREGTADEVQKWIDWWQPSYEAARRLSAGEIATLKAGGWWPPATGRQVAEMPPPVAQRQIGTIDGVFHALDGKVRPERPLSIEDMNEIAAAGWAGELGEAEDKE